MFFLYSLLLTVGFVAFLPRFLFRKKYRAGLRERFGRLPAFARDERPVLWLHCVSVGETNAARPVVKEFLREFPEYRLVVSTTTLAGQTLAREVFKKEAELVFYFPFDWKFTVRRALAHIKPKVVMLMETELWFNFVREAHKGGAWVFIVNGRLSEKSAARYKLIPNTMRRVLHHVDLALMQTNADMKRLLDIGSRGTKVRVTGNVKFDQAFDETEKQTTRELRARFAVSDAAPLVVAASTHQPEERLILEAFKAARRAANAVQPRLLLAPRHPERFAEVEKLIAQSGFRWAKRSAAPSSADETAEVLLLDSIGELRAVYPLAAMVFVGGSLIAHGGQSILEPALSGCAIVTGFHTANFAAAVREFAAHDALRQLPKLAEKDIPARLAEVFAELLNDAEERQRLAKNAFAVMRKNRGATEKTVEHIRAFIRSNGKL